MRVISSSLSSSSEDLIFLSFRENFSYRGIYENVFPLLCRSINQHVLSKSFNLLLEHNLLVISITE
ncbi:unnamed protein product [Ceratitis capitata]|uniref:(Mediterranean fruit fly) hypothetical protein n=1 Tax=Ceratitis capitata TaxID=7213 RepID=A0A811UZ10_CERCA|nr:unnamed protein product [Ceratitis capitata]